MRSHTSACAAAARSTCISLILCVDHDDQVHRRRRQPDVVLGTEQGLDPCQHVVPQRGLQHGHHFGLDVDRGYLGAGRLPMSSARAGTPV